MAETQSRGRSVLADRDTWWADPIGDSGQDRPHGGRWWIVGLVFLLPFLIPATQYLLQSEFTPLHVLEWLLLCGYGVMYLVFPTMFGRERRTKLLFSLAMLAVGIATVMVPGASSYVLLYATATIAFLLPAAWALIFDVAGMLVAMALLFAVGRLAGSTGDLGSVAGVTAAMFFMSNLIRAIRRLEIANREIGTLAVATERERVARDLHDLLGHSLTTITVKAGLARRVLESSGDIPRAVQEIREVEGLTRSALSDVRATVTEYREVSLPAEIAGARAALRAAEIEADLPHAVDNVRAELRSTFGYVLREAITNVLRHSGASRVKVRLGCGWLEVEDDGTATEVVAGNGLRGLSERLAAVGGTLRTSVRPGGGLAVRAEVPEPEAATAAAPAVRAETAGGTGLIRVLLADDQAMVRGALATVLGLEADIEVVGQVGSGEEVVAAAREAKPDVALLDVQMPGKDGLTAAAELHQALPSCRVIICTTFGRPGYLARAMAAGAAGFVVKDAPPEQLVEAVRRVHSGLRVVDPALAAESLATGASPLTARERDALSTAKDGSTVADIAKALFLSEGTVRNHLSAAIGKTGARTRAEAVRLAEERGWL